LEIVAQFDHERRTTGVKECGEQIPKAACCSEPSLSLASHPMLIMFLSRTGEIRLSGSSPSFRVVGVDEENITGVNPAGNHMV